MLGQKFILRRVAEARGDQNFVISIRIGRTDIQTGTKSISLFTIIKK